jgi:hypothetical protein
MPLLMGNTFIEDILRWIVGVKIAVVVAAAEEDVVATAAEEAAAAAITLARNFVIFILE